MTGWYHSSQLIAIIIGIIISSFTLANINDNIPNITFWDNQWPNDIDTGNLTGTVLFAQGQIIPSKNGVPGDDTQPHLTALRKTLVMFQPTDGLVTTDQVPLQMKVKDKDGVVLGSMDMEHPNDIPKQAGWIPNVDPNIEFPTFSSDHYIIQGQSNLDQTNDQEAAYLMNILNTVNSKVEVKYWDGSWTSNLYLPSGDTVPSDSVVLVTSNAAYAVIVNYPNTVTGGWRTKRLTRNTQVTLVLSNGEFWVADSDLEHNQYIFGKRFWTATMDAKWVKPGLQIDFQQQAGESNSFLVGSLSNVEVGGETELIITAIDVGFLTEPRNEFTFKDDETTHREYFQTTPATRLIVVQYETLHLTEVMLPTGVLYDKSSSDTGGWHSGDMRQYTGKVLISHGIDLANYGISSTSGSEESAHPFTCALLAAHNTVGMYTNGRVVHGGSGGNGIITLDSSVGNEMSHEAGHNFGLGHYVRGFEGSVHRASDKPNSAWGWDSDFNVFTPNFYSANTNQIQCCCPSNNNDRCEAPFLQKFQYGKDAMSGGSAGHWGSNRYTLYTPNTMSIIQDFLESKLLWHPDSSTGFVKYNPDTKQMEETVNPNASGKIPRLFGVPVTTIVGYYDPYQQMTNGDYIFPALHGAYGFVYDGDGEPSTSGCELRVQTNNGTQVFHLSPTPFTANIMNKFHVNVATNNAPSRAELLCNNQILASKNLIGPQTELHYTVNGEATESRAPVASTTPAPTTPAPTTPAPTTPALTTSAPTSPSPASSPPTNGETGDGHFLYFLFLVFIIYFSFPWVIPF